MELDILTGLNRVTLNAGLMKPLRGSTLIAGKQKIGGKMGYLLLAN